MEGLLNTEAPSECDEEQVFYTGWNAAVRLGDEPPFVWLYALGCWCLPKRKREAFPPPG